MKMMATWTIEKKKIKSLRKNSKLRKPSETYSQAESGPIRWLCWQSTRFHAACMLF